MRRAVAAVAGRLLLLHPGRLQHRQRRRGLRRVVHLRLAGRQDRIRLPAGRARHRRRPVGPEPGRRRHTGVVGLRGQGRGAELLGFLVRAVPGRGAASSSRPPRRWRRSGVQFLGINVKDTKEAGADFVASKQVSYPSIYDPSMRTLLAIRGLPDRGHPLDDRDRPAGPGRAHLLEPITDPPAADRHRVGHRRGTGLRWRRHAGRDGHGDLRAVPAGRAAGGGRRRGVVRLAVRHPAGARLPGVPRLAGRAQAAVAVPPAAAVAARRSGPTRVSLAVRGKAVTATALFVLGFTVVFLAQSVAVIGFSRALLVEQRDPDAGRRGGHHRDGPGDARPDPAAAGRAPAARPADRPDPRARRCSARSSRSAGRSAWARPWSACCRWPTPPTGAARPGAGCRWCSSTAPGWASRSCCSAFGFGWAAGALAFLRRHSRTIQIVGAVCLIVLGLLMVTGVWGTFIAWLQGRFAGIETVL